MQKFITLVKKEVLELLTPQIIVPLVISAVMFYVLGNVIGKEMDKAKAPTNIAISDFDQTASSKSITQALEASNFKVKYYEKKPIDEIKTEMEQSKTNIALVVPEGFENNIQVGKQSEFKTYTIMKNFSFMGGKDATMITMAISALNDSLSTQLIKSNIENADPTALKNPIITNPNVMIGDKTTAVDPTKIMNFVSQQTFFIPIILFIVLMFAGQMIMTSMATEKENKTLETLLSVPVGRKAIVGSKMVGASVIALLMSVVYMVGFRSYMSGMTGGTMGQAVDEATKTAMRELGLVFATNDYVLLGLSLFAAILVALAMALILGAFTEDIKSVQGAITPLMVLMMIPYFLVMFLDFSSLSAVARYAVYLIPFSHPFLAGPNLFLGNDKGVVLGIIYQFIIFLILLYLAAKIFSTDKIMTMKINWGKKKT